jgi:hypothetical protein
LKSYEDEGTGRNLKSVIVEQKKIAISALVIVSFLLLSSLVLPGLSNWNKNKVMLFSSASSPPITQLGSEWIGGSAVPGDTNRELNITILNLNPYQIVGVTEQLNLASVPFSNSTGGSLASAFVSSALRSGEAGSAIFTVNVLSNTSTFYPNPVYVPLTVFYLNNVSQSVTVGLSVPVYLFPGRAQLSIIPLSTSIVVKGSGNVSYAVSNTGNAPALSPTVSLHLESGFVVTENQSSTVTGDISAGGVSTYSWEVAVGKGVGIGTYPGTLSVAYNDPTGATYATSFFVSISVVGTVALNIQGLVIVQNLGNLTVKGTIVNFGTAPASFTQVTGYLRSSSAPETGSGLGEATSYVGNIGAGRTAYFTLVLPYPAQNSQLSTIVNVTLIYQGSSSTRLQISNTTPFVLQSSSSLQAPGLIQERVIEIALAIVVVIVAIVGVLAYRRQRRKNGTVLVFRRRRKNPSANPKQPENENKKDTMNVV